MGWKNKISDIRLVGLSFLTPEAHMEKAKALILSSRPWSFPMTVISVLVGTLLAWQAGEFDPFYLAVVALGMVLFHGATNLINDYHDYKSGVDSRDSMGAQYRDQPLLESLFEPGELLGYCFVLYLGVAGIGGYLTYVTGLPVLIIGLLGFFASYMYTGGGLGYKYLGWGEFSAFLVWGPLIVTGSYYVQAEKLSFSPVLVSIPLGLLVSLVLLANNIRDRSSDKNSGATTVATLLGERKAVILFSFFIIAIYSVLSFLIVVGVLSYWSLLCFMALPIAYHLVKNFLDEIPDDADAKTAKLEILFGFLLTVSLIIEKTL